MQMETFLCNFFKHLDQSITILINLDIIGFNSFLQVRKSRLNMANYLSRVARLFGICNKIMFSEEYKVCLIGSDTKE